MKTQHKVIIGDSRQMQEVIDESVHLIITSPPYWQLKDYGDVNQIGYNDTYEDYINNLNLVWRECHRILHNGCRLCINIGDQFARSVYYGRYKVIPIRTEIIKFCESVGFDYMGAIIWQKVTTCNTTGGARIMGSYPYPRNGVLKLDYEFILIFKKYGNPPSISEVIKEQSRLTKEEWNQYFIGHWNFPGEKQNGHVAMFPEELPKRLIKMFSFVNDTILDPFLGSGTTSLAAKKINRNSIGYEINEDFIPNIEEKLGVNNSDILIDASYELVNQGGKGLDLGDEISKLDYIFKDPIKLNKKIEPKRGKFTSKIDDSHSASETYYRVKQIISPSILVLNNGHKVRLLGVREKSSNNAEAIRYLQEKVRGERVFIRLDDVKYDNEENLFCYLYLSNKTFLNAHLIKHGFVDVDIDFDYKYRSKFLDLLNRER
ncbi:MAG: DNA methyltransferase [Spirochaetota bacterium]|nr:DNA methyltransferase [Spirochaetota bacterium]